LHGSDGNRSPLAGGEKLPLQSTDKLKGLLPAELALPAPRSEARTSPVRSVLGLPSP